MRFIPDSIQFNYTTIKTGIDMKTGRVERWEDEVRLHGVFDIWTPSKLRADLVLNDVEREELRAFITKVAKRYDKKIKEQVLYEVQAELTHGN